MVTARQDRGLSKPKDALRLIDQQRPARTPAAADKGPERLAALRALSAPVPGIQDHAPRQPARVVERVFSNRAFEDFPLRVQEARHHIYPPGLEGLIARHWKKTTPAEIYLKKAEAFLRNLFPSLTAIPEITFTPAKETAATEQWVLKQATDSFSSAGLDGQAWQLSNAYNALCALRQIFAREAEGVSASPLETAIPVRYLPELLLAAPVWFVLQRGNDRNAAGADCAAVRYFCDLMPSEAFAALFQIYNGFPPRLLQLHRRRPDAAGARPSECRDQASPRLPRDRHPLPRTGGEPRPNRQALGEHDGAGPRAPARDPL